MSLSVDLSSPQVVGHLPTFDPVDPTVVAWWQDQSRRDLQSHPRLRRLRHQGRLRRPRRPLAIPPHSRRGRQRRRPRAQTPRRHRPLSRLRLQQPPRLQRPQSRPRPRRLRQLPRPRRQVRTQRRHPDQDTAPSTSRSASPPRRSSPRSSTPAQAIELQITQEYLGQQRHMVFLVPMWKTTLDTDMRANNRSTPVKEIVEGKSFHQPLGGFVGVANVGLDTNWMHHPMAMANLYGFGKLAWNPDLTTDQILDTWTRLTWGNNPTVVSTINELQRHSWHVYEQYTGNLGIGTLTNILELSLRPRHRVRRAQRLGPMVPRRRHRHRHGPHRSHRHRLHRPVSARTREGLRRRQHLPRRSSSLHASRSLHTRSPRRKNCRPVRLRRPLRRRSQPRRPMSLAGKPSKVSSTTSATTKP